MATAATAAELAEAYDLTTLRRLRDTASSMNDRPAERLLQAACDLIEGRSLLDAIDGDKVREQIASQRARLEQAGVKPPAAEPEEEAEPELAPGERVSALLSSVLGG